MGEIPAAPAAGGPPNGAPLAGMGSVPIDGGLHGIKGAGFGGGGNGSAEKSDKGKKEFVSDEETPYWSDIVRFGAARNLRALTIHEAVSQMQGNSEAVTLSPAQLAEFQSFLNRRRPDAKHPSGQAYVVGGMGKSTWFSVNAKSDLSDEELMSGLSASSDGPQLTPAVPRVFLDLPEDVAPRTTNDETLLFKYTADPRAGLAIEGAVAFIAHQRMNLHLERQADALYDFVEQESKKGWHISVARDGASRPIDELQKAVAHAQSLDANLIIDAADKDRLNDLMHAAVRDLKIASLPTKIHVVFGPVQLSHADESAPARMAAPAA